MVTRESVATAARNFLKALAEAAKAQLGSRPEHPQRSRWIVRTGPSTMSSEVSERRVFDRERISRWCNVQMIGTDFAEQLQLRALLSAAGIPDELTRYGFFLPLVRHWLELPDPFAFEEIAISKVVEEFVDAVVDGRVVTRSRDGIGWLDLTSGPVVLEEGMSIRPVTEEELWEFGEIDGPRWPFLHPLALPSEEWKILDIKLRHARQEEHPARMVEVARGAALVALRLASSGSLEVVRLGGDANYGTGALGRTRSGEPMPRALGRWEAHYVLGPEVAQRLKESWPRLREIMESEDHYLRLPAQRLVDGGGRDRLEDAIIDYSIGLEALLTEGIRDELSYRLALRGATVLAWRGGNKQKFYNSLREFYDVRGSIVHGGPKMPHTRLANARSQGEKALRDIWWWYFEKGASGLREATRMIDERILE